MAKGIAVGLTRGHIVSKIEVPSWVPKKQRKQNHIIITLLIKYYNVSYYLLLYLYLLNFSKKKS